ncbi:MAG: class I SAM-dependent methyltransferase [Anaerolineales bacterium]|nr:class I SAM-dependent methyltransferase [Anaerolineales bacterium]
MSIHVLITALVLFLAFLFWELILCEGVHLGPKAVVWLYNLTAGRYEGIKRYDPAWERNLLGDAVVNATWSLPDARLLDVGAGTARVARAIFPREDCSLQLTCVEPAIKMLAQGRALTARWPVQWVQAYAVPLPFPENSFDLVLCLEVLEFTPDSAETIRELKRVLRPGGWLIITNRVSGDAFFLVGHTIKREAFPAFLEDNGLKAVETYPWQLDYDLVWTQKPVEH